MVRNLWAAVAAVVLAGELGCSGKSSESPGVPTKQNPDPKAPGLMRPPGQGGAGLPKDIERKRGYTGGVGRVLNPSGRTSEPRGRVAGLTALAQLSPVVRLGCRPRAARLGVEPQQVRVTSDRAANEKSGRVVRAGPP